MQTSEEQVRAGLSDEILGGLALLAIAGLFLLQAGRGLQDWLFPLTLAATLAMVGLILIGRGVLRPGRKRSLIPAIVRGQGIDVAVFVGLAVVYVALVRPVGFWVMSAVMIFITSMYLAVERTGRAALASAVVAIAIVLVAHYVMLDVFYVPLPQSTWLPFL